MMIKVSVGIPVYNASKYIEACARSLFSQTLKELELIFVDDCSSDNSIEILLRVLEEFPERKSFVKVLRHKKNGGPMAARKTAIASFTGSYFTFCDSDDIVDVNMYESMYRKAEETQADVIHCGLSIIHENGKVQKNQETVDTRDYREFFLWEYDTTITPFLVTHMFKRSAVNIEQCYLPDFLFFCEDFLFLAQLLRQCRSVGCCPQSFYQYFRRSGSICHNSRRRNMLHQRHVMRYLFKTESDPVLQNALKIRFFSFIYSALRSGGLTDSQLKNTLIPFSSLDLLCCRRLKLKKKIRIFLFMLKKNQLYSKNRRKLS